MICFPSLDGEGVMGWGDMFPPLSLAGEGVGGEGKDIEKRGGISNNPASK